MRNPKRLRKLCSAPRNPEVEKLKKKFEALNEFIRERNGWSIPGDPEVRFEALPDSTLPADLRGLALTSRDRRGRANPTDCDRREIRHRC